MAGRHHAVTGTVKNIKILQFAVERVRSFNREQSGREPMMIATAFEVIVKVRGALNYDETALRGARELMESPRLIEGALGQAVPGRPWPSFDNRE